MTLPASDVSTQSRARVRIGLPAAIVVFVVYSIIFIGLWKQSGIAYGDALSTAENTLRAPVRSLVGGTIWLVVFLVWARWDHVFADWRRMRMGFWLWLPAGLMLLAVVLQFAGVSWGEFTGEHLLWIVVAAVLVGFAEETLFRGIILRALREGGRREGLVVLISSLWFGLFHLTNLITGSSFTAVIGQVGAASLAGIALYLWRRGTGVLLGGMVVHGLWDMSIFLLGVHKIADSLLPALGTLMGEITYVAAAIALIVIWRRRDVASSDVAV